jgi:purine-nucleoside/S-methyl-5'-thioadenosine phosphorylase / adenosine deaminase
MDELTRADCIVPEWPAPAHVKALVTTRAGGVSTGPYATLNLGFATADANGAVRANRARLQALLPQPPRWLKQVHGARVVCADGLAERPEADASVAHMPGTVCAVLIADCLPVLFTNVSGTVVAAAHAGWRGLAAGVLDNTIADIGRAGVPASDLLAYIGPGIGASAFEVGNDVHQAFVGRDPKAAGAFKPHAAGKWLADLAALARAALARCGITRVYGGGLCTYSDPVRFYSHRRDRVTGRMAALIWRAAR